MKSEFRMDRGQATRSRLAPWDSAFKVQLHTTFRYLSYACFPFAWVLLDAATSSGSDEIPPLRPPRGEIPPDFWEAHRISIVISGIILLIIISTAVWFFLRTRPKASIPPEVQARQALEALLAQPENGALLSRVSQIVRRYVIGAFGLPPGELTTTEFCEVISKNPPIDEPLSAAISNFLRDCDRRKFALSPDDEPINAVPTALKFVDEAEKRRAELRKAEQSEAVRR